MRKYNEFLYEIVGKGDKINITGYTGNEPSPVLPAYIDGIPVSYLEDSLFRGNASIKSFTVPDTVLRINSRVFEDCHNLQRISLSSSLESLGSCSFRKCPSLEEITIPDGVTYMGYGIFKDCTSLKRITLPKNIERIFEHTFENCRALTDISIPDKVISIDQSAFKSCDNLSSIKFPKILNEIGEDAFRYCYSIKNLRMPDNAWVRHGAFYGCASLENVHISEGCKTISPASFSYNPSLKTVVISEGVTGIFSSAFSNCPILSSVTIPDSVSYIGDTAFECCPDLTIKCNPGSYAEEYAKKFKIPTKSIISNLDQLLQDTKSDFKDSSYLGTNKER